MRVRRELIVIPAVCALVAWILNSVAPAYTWTELMEHWGIVHPKQFTMLAVLGVVLVAFTLVLRILRDASNDH